MTMNRDNKQALLYPNVSGYIGGRRVRVLVRDNGVRLNGRSWQNQIQIAVDDVLNPALC
jgi:hypothetical protein